MLEDYLVMMKTALFCGVMNANLLLFSYYGNKLTEESASVALEISKEWFNIKSPKLRKHLTLIMLRSQRKQGIKAGNFCYINFETYSKVFSEIASYFSILRVLLLGKK